ncbi:hypothetical protein AWV80_33380 [Cupriavidus sp. UYMU48A]|nr:hypothetical protein AWV80_33380 [Cupriavidus sp. UYMU48A]
MNVDPTADELAEITLMAAEELKRFGIEPKVALLSHSNFGGLVRFPILSSGGYTLTPLESDVSSPRCRPTARTRRRNRSR